MDAQPPSKRSWLEKLLFGCALGCGGLLITFLIAASIGTYWFITPGEQVATANIVGEESVGLVRITELADDPGIEALLGNVLERVDQLNRRQQQRTLPESMQWITQFQRTAKASDFHKFLPKDATLILEQASTGEAGDSEPELVLAANFRTMVRPLKALLSLINRSEGQANLSSEYRGHDIHHFSADGIASFVGSTLLIASSEAALHKAIDRVEGAAPSSANRFSQEVPAGHWDADGVIDDNGAALVLLSKLLGDENLELPPGSSELDLRFGFDVVSADEIEARAFLDCADADQASAWLAELEGRIPALQEQASERGLTLNTEIEVQGSRVIADVHILGLKEAINQFVHFD